MKQLILLCLICGNLHAQNVDFNSIRIYNPKEFVAPDTIKSIYFETMCLMMDSKLGSKNIPIGYVKFFVADSIRDLKEEEGNILGFTDIANNIIYINYEVYNGLFYQDIEAYSTIVHEVVHVNQTTSCDTEDEYYSKPCEIEAFKVELLYNIKKNSK